MTRFTFTASLIAASAFAQSGIEFCDFVPDDPSCPGYVHVPFCERNPDDPDCQSQFEKALDAVFEKNDAGQWQVKSLDNLPQLSWADVDEQTVMDWLTEKEDIMEAQNKKWENAWEVFMDAIELPTENFMARAENLSDEGREIGLKTDEEIVRFVANNTFVDGESLNEIYPQVEEFLTAYRAEAGKLDEVLDFNLFRKTPNSLVKQNNLQLTGYYDVEGIYHPNQAMQDYDDDATSEESSDDEPEAMEVAMEKIESAFISYGYDPAVVQAWLQDSSASWQELEQAQNEEAAAMAKADVAEAAEYINNILDNMVADLREMQMEHQEAFEEALDARVADLKSQVEAKAQEGIDRLENRILDLQQLVEEKTRQKEEEVTPAEDADPSVVSDTVAFAVKAKKTKKAKSTASSSSAFIGYGAIALGAAATAAYFYKKKAESKVIQTDQDLDEGFTQV